MKTSAMMFIPRNIQKRKTMYMIANNGRDSVVIPGMSAQLKIMNNDIMVQPFSAV